jgi:hypothetical protein
MILPAPGSISKTSFPSEAGMTSQVNSAACFGSTRAINADAESTDDSDRATVMKDRMPQMKKDRKRRFLIGLSRSG